MLRCENCGEGTNVLGIDALVLSEDTHGDMRSRMKLCATCLFGFVQSRLDRNATVIFRPDYEPEQPREA